MITFNYTEIRYIVTCFALIDIAIILKLNDFLKKKAINMGIKVVDDDIFQVELDENGFIDFIVGKKTKYKSDFYIDATGFKRVLMNKLGFKWKSFNNYLKVNSAITFQTPDEKNYGQESNKDQPKTQLDNDYEKFKLYFRKRG